MENTVAGYPNQQNMGIALVVSHDASLVSYVVAIENILGHPVALGCTEALMGKQPASAGSDCSLVEVHNSLYPTF